MRAITFLLVLLALTSLASTASASHLGPVDDRDVPNPPAAPAPSAGGCLVSHSAARLCVAVADGSFQHARASTYGPVGTGLIVAAPDPTSPRIAAGGFVPVATAGADTRLYDDNGDVVPDGGAAAAGVGFDLFGLSGAGAGVGLRDTSGDGIPDSPSASGVATPSAPGWLPRPPNTPYPLPSLRPVYDALGL